MPCHAKGGHSSFAGIDLLQRLDGSLVVTRRGYERYHDLAGWLTDHFIEPLWADMRQKHKLLRAHLNPPDIRQRFWLRLARLNR